MPHKAKSTPPRLTETPEVRGKLGVLQHPHPSSVIPVTHHANSAQSKACLRRPGLHPGRKQDRRALPYNPLLPPRAQEAGTEELSLPPELRLFQAELRQVFASPGAPFDATSRDEPVRRHLTETDRRGAASRKRDPGRILQENLLALFDLVQQLQNENC